MGNTVSEEGTAVDLTETERRFFRRKAEFRRTKYEIAHLEPQQIIAAHRHVDNICVTKGPQADVSARHRVGSRDIRARTSIFKYEIKN